MLKIVTLVPDKKFEKKSFESTNKRKIQKEKLMILIFDKRKWKQKGWKKYGN